MRPHADNRDEQDVGTSAHAQPPGRRGGKAPTPPAFHRIDRGTHPDGIAAGGLRMSEAFRHRPVMVDEVVELMRTVPPGVVVDATVGAAGHAKALLEARSDLRLVGLDRDGDAVAAATEALAGFADRVVLRRAGFDEMTTTLQELGHETGTRGHISGALFDLGVSSPQLDRPARGFSYRADGPLDMRMDLRQSLTAADVVNGYAEDDLSRVLYEYGGERFVGCIARAVAAARPITSTVELVDIVRTAIPGAARRRGGHPGQADVPGHPHEVNRELDLLPGRPDRGHRRPRPRRPVRGPGVPPPARTARQGPTSPMAETGGCTCPPGLPCVCGADRTVRLLGRGGWSPGATEIAANPRRRAPACAPARSSRWHRPSPADGDGDAA